MRAIIMAAGPDWPGGVRKHLLQVRGETLLDRAVRLALQYIDDVVITVREDNQYSVAGATSVVTETLESASQSMRGKHEHLWADDAPTVVLFADVFYTDAAMKTIMTERVNDWRFYCRFTGSQITGKLWGEYFAFRFTPKVKRNWLAACGRVDDLYARKVINRKLPWEVYRAMCGVPDNLLRTNRNYGHATIIDDVTDDFDSPKEYDQWLVRVASLL